MNGLERRLIENYPTLRAAEFGPTAAHDLARSDMVLPILDGLDELSVMMRPRALQALSTAAERPLILTSRTTEYEQAVLAKEGRVLRAAAVIEAAPLEAADIEEYLRRCLDAMDGSWPELLAGLSSGPIAESLGTPLRLWLLRKVYIDSNKDPATLCGLGTASAIEEHLLDALIPSLLEADRERKRLQRGRSKEAQEFQTRHDWNSESVFHWLAYFADFVSRRDGLNLKWWALHADSPVGVARIRVAVGAIAGALFGLVLGPALGLVGAGVGALLFRISKAGSAEPRYANLRLKGPSGQTSYEIRGCVQIYSTAWSWNCPGLHSDPRCETSSNGRARLRFDRRTIVHTFGFNSYSLRL
jgi:hypothetical protein